MRLIVGFLSLILGVSSAVAGSYVASEVVQNRNLNTKLIVTYTPSVLGGGSQTVEAKVYIYSASTGELAKHKSGQALCGPCVVSLSDTKRKGVVDVRATMLANSGVQADLDGYAVITISNDDSNVGMLVELIDTRNGSPTAIYQPKPIAAPAP